MSNPFSDIIVNTATPARPLRPTANDAATKTTNNRDDNHDVNGKDITNTVDVLNSKLKQLGVNVEDNQYIKSPSSHSPLVFPAAAALAYNNNTSEVAGLSPTAGECTSYSYSARPLPSIPNREQHQHPQLSPVKSQLRRYRLSLGEEANTIRSRFANDEIDQVLDYVEQIRRIIGDFDASVILNKIGYYDPEVIEVSKHHDDVDTVSDMSSISGLSQLLPQNQAMVNSNHIGNIYYSENDRLVPNTSVETPAIGPHASLLPKSLVGMTGTDTSPRPHPGQRFLSRSINPIITTAINTQINSQEEQEITGGDIPSNVMISDQMKSDEISPLSAKSPLTLQTDHMEDEDTIQQINNAALSPNSQLILQRQPFGTTMSSVAAGNPLNMTLTDPFNQSTARNLFSDTITSNRVSQRYSAGLNMRAASLRLASSNVPQSATLNNTVTHSEPISPRELFPALKKEPSFHAMRILTPGKHSQLFQMQQSQVFSSTIDKNGLSLSVDSTNMLGNTMSSEKLSISNELFAEFNVIGINPAILKGGNSFSSANTQVAEVLCTLPPLPDGKSLIVDNIHEYIFPQGAKLSIMTSSEYARQCKQHFFESKHKILQFTDSTNRIFHAYTLVINEKVENPSKKLMEKLLHVQELNLAAETILRYYRHYQARKLKVKLRKLKVGWVGKSASTGESNIDNQRASLDGNQTVFTDVGAVGGDKQANIGKRPKSRIRTLVSSALKPIKNTLIGKKAAATKATIQENVKDVVDNSESTKDLRSRVQSVPHEKSLSIDDEIVRFVPEGDGSTTSRKKRSYSAPDVSGMVAEARAKGLLNVVKDTDDCAEESPLISLDSHTTSTSIQVDTHSSTPVQFQANTTNLERSKSNDSATAAQLLLESQYSSFYTDHSQSSYPIDDLTFSPVAAQQSSSKLALFRESLESVREWVVIQQKAFCILSEAPLPVLFFKMLQAIIDIEQKQKTENGTNDKNDEDGGVILARYSDIRSTSEVQTSSGLVVTPREKFQLKHIGFITKFLLSIQSQDQKRLMQKLQKSDVTLSCLPLIPSLVIPRKPPSLAEWTVGMLFSFLPVDVIIHIHSLLLIEKSLIVIGRDATLTTIVTTAFVNLLLPLKWAGIFVPLLPPLALEVLDAPVPYIIGLDLPGVYGRDSTKRPKIPISPTSAILYMDDFLQCPHAYSSKQRKYKYQDGIVAEKLDSLTSIIGSGTSNVNTAPISPVDASSRPTTMSNLGRNFSMDDCVPTSKKDEGCRDCLFFETPFQMEMELSSIFPSTSSIQVTTIENKAILLKPLLMRLKTLSKQFKWQCEHCGLLQNSPFANIGANNGKQVGSNHCTISCSEEVMPHEVFVKCALMDFDPVIYQPVREILQLFHSYNETYTGGVLSNSHAWQDICHEDLYSHALVVDSKKIMDPLKQRMCIQEHILQTQMFALMLDSQFATYVELHHPRRFICDWVEYHFYKKHKMGKSTSVVNIKSPTISENARKSRSVPFFK